MDRPIPLHQRRSLFSPEPSRAGVSNRRVALCGALTLVVALSACGPESPPTQVTRTDSLGLSMVEVRGGDRKLEWRARRVATLDLPWAEDGLEGLQNWHVVADREGRVFVLDAGSRRMGIFAPDGNALEFVELPPGDPFGLDIGEDGAVTVLDRRRRTLPRYGPDGAALPEVRLPAPLPFATEAHSLGREFFVYEFLNAGQTGEATLLRFDGADQAEVASRSVSIVTPMISYPSCPGAPPGLPLFARGIVWGIGPGGPVVNLPPDYRLTRHGAAGVDLIIQRDLAPRALDRRSVLRSLPRTSHVETTGGQVCEVSREERVDVKGFAPQLALLSDITVSPDGEIWVQRNDLDRARRPVDVFDSGGDYLGTLGRGFPFPAAFLPDGLIAAVEGGLEGPRRVVIYRVEGG
jgi:hypothetical protein